MKTTTYAGIDYSCGTANRDKATGIRYGVISQHTVGQAWYDSAEADYGEPHCPKCGNEAAEPSEAPDDDAEQGFKPYREHGCCSDYYCLDCKIYFDADDSVPPEPVDWNYEGKGYVLTDCLDSDIFVLKSPYFTYAQFCSPCVPGACNLESPLEEPADNNKCYCLGHDWFEDSKAPYPVYSVETGQLIEAK